MVVESLQETRMIPPFWRAKPHPRQDTTEMMTREAMTSEVMGSSMTAVKPYACGGMQKPGFGTGPHRRAG